MKVNLGPVKVHPNRTGFFIELVSENLVDFNDFYEIKFFKFNVCYENPTKVKLRSKN